MSYSRKLYTQLPVYNVIESSGDQINCKINNNQEKLSEKVIAEAQRIIDETRDTNISTKKDVDHNIEQRINEIKFLIDELKNQRKVAVLEEESLKLYRKRIENLIKFLNEKSLPLCEKCIQLRDKHINNVNVLEDEINFKLKKELKTIHNILKELKNKVLPQINEGIRSLRASIYLLDKDMSNKNKALQIDETNLQIAENQLNLSVVCDGMLPLNIWEYTLKEWKDITYKNIENNANDINQAKSLRSFIEIILKQCIENLQNQTYDTNNAFVRHINDLRYLKQCLESNHRDKTNTINNVKQQISDVENELMNKQNYLSVCQLRLCNRNRRPELEFTYDSVQTSLNNELNKLKNNKMKLNEKLIELKATLRCLLQCQIEQEQKINIIINNLKIEETDCLIEREGLIYKSF